MTPTVPIALFGWVAVALALFAWLPPRRAVLVSFLGAWLFLPEAGIGLPGLPDYTKITAASLSVLLGVILFDAGRVVRYRPSWIDLPILAWCLCPFVSSVTNGLGPYDGLSAVVDQAFTWGIPWLVGRVYFDSPETLRELAVAILVGGLIYAPLCLFEIRMSPQLHRWVYGFHPTHFMMTRRFGGYRPQVFMQHGLMLGLWMSSATLIGIWLWRSGTLRTLRGLPMALLAPGLLVTTVLCKSAGALALLAGGLGLLFVNRRLRWNVLVLAAALAGPAYMIARANGLWDGRQVIALAESIDADRAASLAGRLENETLIAGRAMKRPAFGWGRWGRWRVRDERGRDITVSDGLWVITLGQTGLVGLAALTAVLVMPVLLLLRRVPARHWGHPDAAPAAALAVILVMYGLDSLLNAMLNPVYLLGAGGLCGLYLWRPRAAPLAAPLDGRQVVAMAPPPTGRTL